MLGVVNAMGMKAFTSQSQTSSPERAAQSIALGPLGGAGCVKRSVQRC